ncbi:MAG: leucine-rich repeat domain-containing protein [Bacteroidales bacterium]
MRRIFTFILVAILNLSLFAQINGTEAQVHLDEPGTLSAKLKEQGIIFGSINKLIVTGKFNQRDFSSMKMQMTNLQYVDISGTDITEIPSEAMRDKSQLTHFYAPASVRKIGQYAFYGCSNLQNLPFEPASIDTIRDYAFDNCYLMKGDLIFSEKLSYLGNAAFRHSAILKVDLSNSVHLYSLSGSQFQDCSSLTSVILSPTINTFGWGVFYSCSSLQEIDLSVCTNLTSIDSDCFNNCTSLRKVVLPESMRQIYTPFQSCNNLREIVVKSTTAPSIQEMTFGSVNWDEAKLFVPIGSKETYEKAQHWNLFYDIFEIGLMVKHNPGGIVKQNGEAVPNNKIIFHDAKETAFEIIPQDGYEVRVIRFKGEEQTPSNLFTVPAGTENAVVDVEFALKKFDVAVNISGEGRVKMDNNVVTDGMVIRLDSASMAQFIIHPADGFILNELTFNGEVNIVQQDSVYVTPPIQYASVLNIQFASEAEVGAAHKLHFVIGENGRVDYMNTPLLPSTTISVKEGEPAVFTFYPAATYRLAKVMLDTENVTAQVENNQLTLSNITKESNVTVSFEVDPVV